jgi:hypothetical protein
VSGLTGPPHRECICSQGSNRSLGPVDRTISSWIDKVRAASRPWKAGFPIKSATLNATRPFLLSTLPPGQLTSLEEPPIQCKPVHIELKCFFGHAGEGRFLKRQSDRRAWSKAWRALVESPKVPAVARKLRSRHPDNRFFPPGRPLTDVVNQGIGASQIAGMPVRTTSYTTKTRRASQSFLRSTDSVHQSNHKMALQGKRRKPVKSTD